MVKTTAADLPYITPNPFNGTLQLPLGDPFHGLSVPLLGGAQVPQGHAVQAQARDVRNVALRALRDTLKDTWAGCGRF